jgi:hypothetical protein
MSAFHFLPFKSKTARIPTAAVTEIKKVARTAGSGSFHGLNFAMVVGEGKSIEPRAAPAMTPAIILLSFTPRTSTVQLRQRTIRSQLHSQKSRTEQCASGRDLSELGLHQNSGQDQNQPYHVTPLIVQELPEIHRFFFRNFFLGCLPHEHK